MCVMLLLLLLLQVLLTRNDLSNKSSLDNLLNTISALLSMKVIPILNGNDVVSPNPHMNADLQNVRPFVTQNKRAL